MPIVASGFAGIGIEQMQNSVMFDTLVREALRKIDSKPAGHALLAEFGRHNGLAKAYLGNNVLLITRAYSWVGGRKVDEIVFDPTKDEPGTQWLAGSKCIRTSEADACNGTGCASKVLWNANVIDTPDGARPSFIGLAHELVHAHRNANGTATQDLHDEEYLTVGIVLAATQPYVVDENTIRAEHGISPRRSYAGV